MVKEQTGRLLEDKDLAYSFVRLTNG